MDIADLMPGYRQVVVDNVGSVVDENVPPMRGFVRLLLLERGGGRLQLVMPMPDALLLLNALRALEHVYQLEDWSARIGTDVKQMERVHAEVKKRYPLPK